jgi:hypothetical protein
VWFGEREYRDHQDRAAQQPTSCKNKPRMLTPRKSCNEIPTNKNGIQKTTVVRSYHPAHRLIQHLTLGFRVLGQCKSPGAKTTISWGFHRWPPVLKRLDTAEIDIDRAALIPFSAWM